MSQQEGLLVKQNWPFLTTTVSTFFVPSFICALHLVTDDCMMVIALVVRTLAVEAWGPECWFPKLAALHLISRNISLAHWYLVLNQSTMHNWIYHWWEIFMLKIICVKNFMFLRFVWSAKFFKGWQLHNGQAPGVFLAFSLLLDIGRASYRWL